MNTASTVTSTVTILAMLAVPLFGQSDTVKQLAVQSDFSYGVPRVDGNYTDQFFVTFPLFDPSLGTLQSVNYSFTDLATLLWGFNDVGEPAGIPFQVNFTGALDSGANSLCVSPGLPINITYDATLDETTMGYSRDISNGGSLPFSPPLAASGTLFNGFSPFVGVGEGAIGFEANASVSTPGDPNSPVSVGLTDGGGSDYGILYLTYNYDTIPTPEPRSTLGAALLALALSKREYLRR